MKVEDHSERTLTVEGWDVRLTTHRLGETWHCKADNVSPGAALARTSGATKEEAEQRALKRATELLIRTRRQKV